MGETDHIPNGRPIEKPILPGTRADRLKQLFGDLMHRHAEASVEDATNGDSLEIHPGLRVSNLDPTVRNAVSVAIDRVAERAPDEVYGDLEGLKEAGRARLEARTDEAFRRANTDKDGVFFFNYPVPDGFNPDGSIRYFNPSEDH